MLFWTGPCELKLVNVSIMHVSSSPPVKLWMLVTLLVWGAVSAPVVHAQVYTTDRWHTVRQEQVGEVQLRPVATASGEGGMSWRMDFRVPPDYGRTLARDEVHLDLLMEGTPLVAVAPDVEVENVTEDGPATVRASLPASTVRTLVKADSARFIGGGAQISVPSTLQTDLKRILAQALAPAVPDSSARRRESKSDTGEGEVFTVVEQQPRLIGGRSQLQMVKQYPSSAKEKGLEGRVFVEFVVDKTGRVRDPSVMRGAHPVLDSAAVRTVRQLQYEPGQQQGTSVKVQVTRPLVFRADTQ